MIGLIDITHLDVYVDINVYQQLVCFEDLNISPRERLLRED